MFCSQCGKEIADSSKFCPECGEPITNTESENSSNEKQEERMADTTQKEESFISYLGSTRLLIISIIVILIITSFLCSGEEDSQSTVSQNETSANVAYDNNLSERKTAVAVFTEAKEWVETPTPQPSSPTLTPTLTSIKIPPTPTVISQSDTSTTKDKEPSTGQQKKQDNISAYFNSIGPLADLYLSESEFPWTYPEIIPVEDEFLAADLLSLERTLNGIKAELYSSLAESKPHIVNIKIENYDNATHVFHNKFEDIIPSEIAEVIRFPSLSLLESIAKGGRYSEDIGFAGVNNSKISNTENLYILNGIPQNLYILNGILCISDFEYNYSFFEVGDKVEFFGKFSKLNPPNDFLISLNDCATARRYPEPFSYEIITAEDLIREFDNDQITATKKYENKYLQVSGILSKKTPVFDMYLWLKKQGKIESYEGHSAKLNLPLKGYVYYPNEYGVIGRYGNIILEMSYKGNQLADKNIILHLASLQMEKIILNFPENERLRMIDKDIYNIYAENERYRLSENYR